MNSMSVDHLWGRYAATWSLDDRARPDELGACVVDGVVYTDPNGVLEGRDALSDYMNAFRDNAPGASFEIESVLHHHDRSLAYWHLRGADGSVVQTGASTAVHAADGRLHTITGFFDTGAGTVEGGEGAR